MTTLAGLYVATATTRPSPIIPPAPFSCNGPVNGCGLFPPTGLTGHDSSRPVVVLTAMSAGILKSAPGAPNGDCSRLESDWRGEPANGLAAGADEHAAMSATPTPSTNSRRDRRIECMLESFFTIAR